MRVLVVIIEYQNVTFHTGVKANLKSHLVLNHTYSIGREDYMGLKRNNCIPAAVRLQ